MNVKLRRKGLPLIAMVLATTVLFGTVVMADSRRFDAKYVAGDFHTHTFLTDGSKTETDVVTNAFKNFGLDWMANSEHGGASVKDPLGNALVNPSGSTPYSIWRWISLRDYSYPIVQKLQAQYPSKVLIQGVEWNVPSHEHASVGIVSGGVTPVSDFEYLFDQNDKDTSRSFENLVKANSTHADAIAGAAWLQANYAKSSYFLLNHPSRKLKYSVADIRDMNNAAPDVFFGMEGLPGHQKEVARGGYTSSDLKAKTYGGADYMTATIGGLWDSLLGEGRKFWIYVNSDFHDNSDTADFWPGEYAKSYTYVTGNQAKDIVNGLRSGNSFAVQGDLINALDFKVSSIEKGRSSNTAVMGGTLETKRAGSDLTITIKFKSPAKNNNNDPVKVDHIDLISGDVTGKATPGTAGYAKDTNDTTRVVKTFTSSDWKVVGGWNVMTYTLKNVDKDMYFRLRGTNLGLGVANQTDASGNPLADNLMGPNNAAKAYADLWFYSNPVFISSGK